MSEPDLDAIQTRATMATRGPWHVEWDGTGYPQRVFNDAAVLVAETCTGPEWPPTDAEFIAHARTDVPALLAHIADLEAERDGVRASALRDAADALLAMCTDPFDLLTESVGIKGPTAVAVWLTDRANDLDAVKESTDG